MAGPVTIVVVGAGSRGTTYARYALERPDLAKVVAVAEPARFRRSRLAKNHGIPPEFQFDDWKLILAKGKIADAVIIATLDHLHAEGVADFAQQGYHILCEKPMATSVADCVSMIRNVTQAPDTSKVFGIGHVLRYSPYNQAVKKVIDSGALGEIINIQHIEPIGNQHFTHSYVRGKWRREDDCSFALMTKSCHDIDIVRYYLSGLKPSKVHSFGSLSHFKKSHKPLEAGSTTSCLDCKYEPDCIWSAKKIYVDTLFQENNEKWARHFVDADALDIENVMDALETTPYGSCVYECDNDVVDHQIVNIEFEGGVTASVTMSAFTEEVCQRRTVIQGTRGELIGDMTTFNVFDFLTRKQMHHTPRLDGGYHGGGDTGLARTFINSVAANNQMQMGVTPEEILDSHLLVFAAEGARKENRVVDFAEFKTQALRA
ncbi:NAD(P)-binding protein [Sarocladium strictum]